MSTFDDHFSKHAHEYSRARPGYPGELFSYLAARAPRRRLAWDCGTGNGQAALELVKHFDRVVATDASAEQVAHAIDHERIDYRIERAEEVSLEAGSVDLVTVAIAVHWFDFERFYSAVRRVAAVHGLLAVWTYHLPVISPAIDRVLAHYYTHVLAGCWPERIRYVEEGYRTLPFPFEELRSPQFETRAEWSLEQLAGFLETWSATQRYLREHGRFPLSLIWTELAESWGEPNQSRAIRWPLHLKVGRIT